MFGDPDRTIDTFLGCDASEKSEVARCYRHRDEQLLRQAVMDGPYPSRVRQRPPLRVGDRDDGHGGEGVEHRLVFGRLVEELHRGPLADDVAKLARSASRRLQIMLHPPLVNFGLSGRSGEEGEEEEGGAEHGE